MTRERSKEDRRVVHIRLTAKGQRSPTDIPVEPMEIFKGALESLTAQEMRDLMRIMTKVAKRVKQIVRRDVGETKAQAERGKRDHEHDAVHARSGSLRHHVRRHRRAREPQAVRGHPVHAGRDRRGDASAPTTPAPRSCTSTRATTTARPRSIPRTFATIKEEIEKRCPILLNFSTGTILEDVTEQCTYSGRAVPRSPPSTWAR